MNDLAVPLCIAQALLEDVRDLDIASLLNSTHVTPFFCF